LFLEGYLNLYFENLDKSGRKVRKKKNTTIKEVTESGTELTQEEE